MISPAFEIWYSVTESVGGNCAMQTVSARGEILCQLREMPLCSSVPDIFLIIFSGKLVKELKYITVQH